ncbi:MAG: coproporphyrinogen III oxidase [Alphaproteobacteria bacterium]|nr:coproporphyrinogen III oxidase [Alphaproteobacteria bacterium]MBV9858772.1 coproporphyrinogen III oxidase [Alphaproteobacteria bacterium]
MSSHLPRPEPLAVYIHWPFCRSKCPYCDFNSHVRGRVEGERWMRALLSDLDRQAALVPEREVVSVFFGGGTPSLMPPETAAALLERVRRHWPTAGDLEVTLEANPNSAETRRFEAFRRAGIDRLSLGIQSLDPAALRFLGRAHGRAEALDAIAMARVIFPRTSFDLIYARPGQSLAAWQDELDEALALAGEHLSLYQLTIEPGTAFATLARQGRLTPPDEEAAAELFEAMQARLAAHGMPAYEISNHARPGAESRHNLAYWRYRDYLGIGPGAHGRITLAGVKHATRQRRLPEAWLAAIESDGTGIEESVPLDRDAVFEEMLMMGLRLIEGIPRARLEAAAGASLETRFGRALPGLIEGGFLTLDAERLAATPAGAQRLNAVLAALVG